MDGAQVAAAVRSQRIADAGAAAVGSRRVGDRLSSAAAGRRRLSFEGLDAYRDRQSRARLRERTRRGGTLACRRPCRADSPAGRTDALPSSVHASARCSMGLRAVKASLRSRPSCSWRRRQSKRMCSGYTRSSGSAIARLLSPRQCGKVCSTSGRPRLRLPNRCRLLGRQHGLCVGLGLGDQAASSALYLVEVAGADAGADQLLASPGPAGPPR